MSTPQRDPSLSNRRVTLPDKPFFYTLDQIASLLQVSEGWLRKQTIYVGRSLDTSRSMISAVNLAEPDETPIWRISEREFIRWLGYHGVKTRQLMKTRRT